MTKDLDLSTLKAAANVACKLNDKRLAIQNLNALRKNTSEKHINLRNVYSEFKKRWTHTKLEEKKPPTLIPLHKLPKAHREILGHGMYQLIEKKFRYVPYSEFIITMEKSFDDLGKYITKFYDSTYHVLVYPEKSCAWMLLMFMMFAEAKFPDVFRKMISMDKFFAHDATHPCAPKEGETILVIDDVSYSGMQIAYHIENETVSCLYNTIVCVPYMTRTAITKIKKQAPNVKLMHHKMIQKLLSGLSLKQLAGMTGVWEGQGGVPKIGVKLISFSNNYTCTIFEHKYADSVSIFAPMSGSICDAVATSSMRKIRKLHMTPVMIDGITAKTTLRAYIESVKPKKDRTIPFYPNTRIVKFDCEPHDVYKHVLKSLPWRKN